MRFTLINFFQLNSSRVYTLWKPNYNHKCYRNARTISYASYMVVHCGGHTAWYAFLRSVRIPNSVQMNCPNASFSLSQYVAADRRAGLSRQQTLMVWLDWTYYIAQTKKCTLFISTELASNVFCFSHQIVTLFFYFAGMAMATVAAAVTMPQDAVGNVGGMLTLLCSAL